MKKLLVITALLLFTGFVSAQSIEKGGIIGTHVWTIVKLKPGVTEEQYLEFLETKFKPVYEKHFEGCKIYTLKGIKGEEKGKLGALYVWKDEDSFKKYIHPEESLTKEGEAAWAKVQPVYDELLKIQEDWDSDFTDWKILF
jgi:hypothetical protein